MYSSPLLVPWLQHVGKHFPPPLLTSNLLSSQWQSLHQCGVHIGLYTLSSRQGLCMGYRITKGVSERCIVRLLLTFLFQKKKKKKKKPKLRLGKKTQKLCHNCPAIYLVSWEREGNPYTSNPILKL